MAQEVTPEEVSELLEKGTIKLIDVRGELEYNMARIEGATLIDQGLVQTIEDTWPKDSDIVFYCHKGIRSLSAARYFVERGFTRVRSMAGGIDAWSQRIDPDVPRY